MVWSRSKVLGAQMTVDNNVWAPYSVSWPHAAQRPLPRFLQEHGCPVEYRECFPEPCDLFLASLFSVLVSLWLRDAHFLQLLQILKNRVQLFLDACQVRRQLGYLFVKVGEFFGLIFYILFLRRFSHFVFLRLLVIGRRRGFLCRDHLC